MAASGKYTDADRARVLELHAAGQGRNDIVKSTGYSTNFVSLTVKADGKSFARGEQVRAATEAKTADNKARRADIVSRLYDQAEAILNRVENTTEYKTVGKGSQGRDVVKVYDFIPPADRRSEASALNTVLSRAEALEKIDTDNGTERAESMIDRLSADMKEAARDALRNVAETDPHDSDL